MGSGRAGWLRPLLLLPLLWPAPGAAQHMAAYGQLAQQCRDSGSPASCRAALEHSHRLKNWAEASKRWRCYTAVLGAEAEMIAATLTADHQKDSSDALLEMRQVCGR
ncbi:hypothetical protein KUL97_04740 [Synechococcus sp. HK05]|uniref:hypothetical protein n=1 Tax=Synechococcus sp. HK05 TaxID=2725975 RepID=UPI001C381796|nr:hypothetical protein [Synechococcus sp. HK05]MBV2351014.1 hypothetical protein [Synechococcus sp. HK05]